jgi:hypothetical protein
MCTHMQLLITQRVTPLAKHEAVQGELHLARFSSQHPWFSSSALQSDKKHANLMTTIMTRDAKRNEMLRRAGAGGGTEAAARRRLSVEERKNVQVGDACVDGRFFLKKETVLENGTPTLHGKAQSQTDSSE